MLPGRDGLAEEVILWAYAKINFSLDVLGLRPDGYHDLRSVMQTISLHDTLSLYIEDEVEGSDAGRNSLPEYSLIDRAIEAVRALRKDLPEIGYRLEKRVPVAAGLGGGSADCAAAIRGTAKLLDIDLSGDTAHEMAVSLGSDVPFFLTGGTALVEGRGETITPLADAPKAWFVLAGVGTPVSTGTVFDAYTRGDQGDGKATDRVLGALSTGRVDFGGNDLLAPAVRTFPEVAQTLDTLSQVAAADPVAMSGSGGTMVAVFDSALAAEAAYETAAGRVPWLTLATTVDRAMALSSP